MSGECLKIHLLSAFCDWEENHYKRVFLRNASCAHHFDISKQFEYYSFSSYFSI